MTALRPQQVDARRVVSEVQTVHAWNRVYQAIKLIAAHRPESGEDFDRADPLAVSAALSVMRWYQSAAPGSVPDDVFAMPDGGLMVEWGDPTGTIARLDFAPGGRCQSVVTYADGREAEFQEFDPPHEPRRQPGRTSRPTVGDGVSSALIVWGEAWSVPQASADAPRKAKGGKSWTSYSLAS